MSKQNQKRAGFRPISESIASRSIPKKSTASFRSMFPAPTRALDHPRRAHAESNLELQVFQLFLARNDVHDIWDQPPAVTYTDRSGKVRSHTFDFLVTFTDKRRVAIAVKPMSKVRSQDLVAELQLIRAELPKDFADEVALVTDHDFDRKDATNAQRLVDFRRHKDEFADGIILNLARDLSGEITIEELIVRSKLGGRAFRAAFRAIFDGILEQCQSGSIGLHTRVKVGSSV